MKIFTYSVTHFLTGSIQHVEAGFLNEGDFLRHLNQWNRDGNGKYLYTSISPVSKPAQTVVFDDSSQHTVIQKAAAHP